MADLRSWISSRSRTTYILQERLAAFADATNSLINVRRAYADLHAADGIPPVTLA
jgi:hypothetical protein